MKRRSTVLITGASTGIGRACALWMDRLGWQVFAGVRRQADAQALRSGASGALTPIMIDVTDETTIRAASAEIAESVGDAGLNGLVNNAGIAVGGILEFVPVELLRRQLEVNVIGQVSVTQRMIPLLRRARGRIVNMSSIAGRSSTPVVGPYAASKHALESLTDVLRLELHPWGIHVVAVEPGQIRTPIWRKSLETATNSLSGYPPEAKRLYGPLIRRAMEKVADAGGHSPDDVAAVVAHALTAETPKIRYVVGRGARLRIWIERLPDRLRDRIVIGRMPVYGDGT